MKYAAGIWKGDKYAAETDLAVAYQKVKQRSIRVCTYLPVANLLERKINVLLKNAQLVELEAVQIFTHPLPI